MDDTFDLNDCSLSSEDRKSMAQKVLRRFNIVTIFCLDMTIFSS
jgi:hypothetical protein